MNAQDQLNQELATHNMTLREWYGSVYLSSEHWRLLRQSVIDERGKKCELCPSNIFIQVHHLNYRNIYDVEKKDLQVVCRKCHKKIHKKKNDKNIVVSLAQNIPDEIRDRISWLVNKYINNGGIKAAKNKAINIIIDELEKSGKLTNDLELSLRSCKSGKTAKFIKTKLKMIKVSRKRTPEHLEYRRKNRKFRSIEREIISFQNELIQNNNI